MFPRVDLVISKFWIFEKSQKMTDLDLLHKHLLPQIAPKGAKKMENLFYEKNFKQNFF